MKTIAAPPHPDQPASSRAAALGRAALADLRAGRPRCGAARFRTGHPRLIPHYLPGLQALSATAWHQQRLDEALAYARRALALAPNAAASHHTVARLLSALGRPAEAAAAHRAGLHIAPDDPGACCELAMALQDSGDADGAERCLRAAMDQHPRDAGPHHRLGNAASGRRPPGRSDRLLRRGTPRASRRPGPRHRSCGGLAPGRGGCRRPNKPCGPSPPHIRTGRTHSIIWATCWPPPAGPAEAIARVPHRAGAAARPCGRPQQFGLRPARRRPAGRGRDLPAPSRGELSRSASPAAQSRRRPARPGQAGRGGGLFRHRPAHGPGPADHALQHGDHLAFARTPGRGLATL